MDADSKFYTVLYIDWTCVDSRWVQPDWSGFVGGYLGYGPTFTLIFLAIRYSSSEGYGDPQLGYVGTALAMTYSSSDGYGDSPLGKIGDGTDCRKGIGRWRFSMGTEDGLSNSISKVCFKLQDFPTPSYERRGKGLFTKVQLLHKPWCCKNKWVLSDPGCRGTLSP